MNTPDGTRPTGDGQGRASQPPAAARVAALVAALAPAARAASANAHAPYSGLRVGAALRTANGAVHAACNVESASFGLTQCAERNALGTAVAAGVRPGAADALLVYVPGDRPLPPCGACRQVMRELLATDAVVVACCDTEAVLAWSLEALLPDAFTGF